MNDTAQWEVDDEGHMRYMDSGIEFFHIEPEALKDPDRLFEISQNPAFDRDQFFLSLIKACENAGIEKITLKIQ